MMGKLPLLSHSGEDAPQGRAAVRALGALVDAERWCLKWLHLWGLEWAAC